MRLLMRPRTGSIVNPYNSRSANANPLSRKRYAEAGELASNPISPANPDPRKRLSRDRLFAAAGKHLAKSLGKVLNQRGSFAPSTARRKLLSLLTADSSKSQVRCRPRSAFCLGTRRPFVQARRSAPPYGTRNRNAGCAVIRAHAEGGIA
jgi:hypothetical protein